MRPFFTLVLSLLISSLFAQTCTSSGGDDLPDMDDYPYTFRCGNDRMFKHNKASSEYKLIKSCNNYWAEGNYYKKNNQIYYSPKYGEFELVENANPNNFRCENGTAKDNRQIFYMGKAKGNVDLLSYKDDGKLYCKDNNKVYFKNRYAETDPLAEITEAKPNKFVLIGDSTSYYAKDDSLVYFSGKIISNADPTSFKVLEYGYSHDNYRAFYNGEIIEGLIGKDFTVLKGNKLLKESSKSWRDFFKDDYSIIIELFYGQIMTEIKDVENGKVLSNVFQPICFFPLPIDINSDDITLYDCFDEYFKEEQMEKHIVEGKEKLVSKGIQIFRFPKIMIIILNRFNNDNTKKDIEVDFPSTLDMSRYNNNVTYDLCII